MRIRRWPRLVVFLFLAVALSACRGCSSVVTCQLRSADACKDDPECGAVRGCALAPGTGDGRCEVDCVLTGNVCVSKLDQCYGVYDDATHKVTSCRPTADKGAHCSLVKGSKDQNTCQNDDVPQCIPQRGAPAPNHVVGPVVACKPGDGVAEHCALIRDAIGGADCQATGGRCGGCRVAAVACTAVMKHCQGIFCW